MSAEQQGFTEASKMALTLIEAQQLTQDLINTMKLMSHNMVQLTEQMMMLRRDIMDMRINSKMEGTLLSGQRSMAADPEITRTVDTPPQNGVPSSYEVQNDEENPTLHPPGQPVRGIHKAITYLTDHDEDRRAYETVFTISRAIVKTVKIPGVLDSTSPIVFVIEVPRQICSITGWQLDTPVFLRCWEHKNTIAENFKGYKGLVTVTDVKWTEPRDSKGKRYPPGLVSTADSEFSKED